MAKARQIYGVSKTIKVFATRNICILSRIGQCPLFKGQSHKKDKHSLNNIWVLFLPNKIN